MKFEIYKDKRKEWRWRLKARNGRKVANSGEGYKRPGACEKAMNRFAIGAVKARVAYIKSQVRQRARAVA
jgi:uncharacterized protein